MDQVIYFNFSFQKQDGLDVNTLEIVVQKHALIRQKSDPIFTITCNYEPTGRTHSNAEGKRLNVKERWVQRAVQSDNPFLVQPHTILPVCILYASVVSLVQILHDKMLFVGIQHDTT